MKMPRWLVWAYSALWVVWAVLFGLWLYFVLGIYGSMFISPLGDCACATAAAYERKGYIQVLVSNPVENSSMSKIQAVWVNPKGERREAWFVKQ